MYAILSDYDSPLSHQDEHTARELLSSLAQVAAADQDNDLIDNDLSPSEEPSSAQTTSLAATAESDSSSVPLASVPAQDERVELLRLLDQAAAELAPRTKQQQLRRPLAAAAGAGSGLHPGNTVSDITGALETTSLGGGSSSSTSAAVAPSRFSNTSTASSITTASENDDEQHPYTNDSLKMTTAPAAASLVWDPAAVATHREDDLDGDDEFGTFYDVQDDPLAFLASVFPHIELAQLEAKIKEASSAGADPSAAADLATTTKPGDLEALIEDLLSQDLITSLTEADAEAAAAANAPAPDPDRFADLSKQQKRRVKAAHKAANSYSLTSARQQQQSVSYASAARGAEDGTAVSALAAAPSGANAWVSFSSQASLLATLLHVPPTRVTSTYYQQSSSLPQTISILLTQVATERDFATQIPNALELRAQLRLIVPPNRASDDDLEVLLSATEGDLSDALDLHHFVREVEASMGTNLTLSSLVARESSTDAAAAGGGEKGGFTLVPSAAARRRATTANNNNNHLLASASASTTATDRYSYEDCASLALEYLVKRNEAFRTAARSFQRGGRGERGAAGYWAEKGREYDRERRKWEERAARATVGERRCVFPRRGSSFSISSSSQKQNPPLTLSLSHTIFSLLFVLVKPRACRHKTQDPYTIDLHGLTLAHALTIVDETCNSWWSANRDGEHFAPPLATKKTSATSALTHPRPFYLPPSDSTRLVCISRARPPSPNHHRRRASLAQQCADPRSGRDEAPRPTRVVLEVGRFAPRARECEWGDQRCEWK